MTKARDLADLISAGNPLADGAISVSEISDLTASAAELNTLDGITASTADLNNVAGINSDVQTQLDLKAPLASPTFTGTVTIGGTTYPTADGTEGQVLTTNGSGAVSFADPAGGGSADFVASGAIANGDVVVLNSDGTVSAISQSSNSAAIQGTTVDVESLSGIGIQRDGAIYDPVNKKVIMSYKTKVVVGTVSGSSISFGTAVTPPNAATGAAMSYDPDTGKIICAYYDTSAGGTVSVGTVSGTSISFGSATQITSSGFGSQSVEYDTNNNKFIVFWRDSSNSSYGTCAVGSVSGTSVTMGSNTVMNSSYSDNFTTVYDTNIDRVVVAYRDLGNSIGKVQVVSISGTTPTLTSAVQFYTATSGSSSVTYLHSVWDSYNNKMVIVGLGGASDESFAIVATPSTSTVTVGSTNIFESGIQNDAVVSFDPVVNKILVVYKDTNNSGYGTLAVGTVSGTSITFDTPIVWNNSAEIYTPCIAYNTDASRFAIGYRQITGGEKFASFTYALANGVQSTNLTSSNYIGVAAEAISDTATGAVTIDGGVGTAALDNYNLSTASYDNVSFSVASQDTTANGVAFKTDGTKMYIAGDGGNDINEYSLSTAWDVSTASYVQNFSVNAQETSMSDVFFKADGTKMYIVGISTDSVLEYTLSTAWDISTASYVQNFSVISQEGQVMGVFFKPDGTQMYIVGSVSDRVHEYSLSTAWDVSTASYVQNFSTSSQDSDVRSLFFKPDGTKMYLAGLGNDNVYSYTLSTAWDISTASYDSISFSIAGQESAATGMTFKTDGTKMYIVGWANSTVYQYTTGTFGGFTIGSTYYVADDGSFSTTNNGRKIGKGIATTKLLVNSNMSGDEMNEYLGGLV